MKINKNKIKTEYLNILKTYREDIKTLDAEERSSAIDCVKNYYSYLMMVNIPYAKLAWEVIENKGKFGQLANIHLTAQSIFEGIKPESIKAVREKIIIMLAYKDAQMRSSLGYNQSNSYYDKIENYHIKVFQSHSTPYAWGGLAPRELIGTGSWMKFYEQNQGIYEAIQEIVHNGKIGQNTEYSTERMLKSVGHSYRVFTLGIDHEFAPLISVASKEQAVLIWKVAPVRIIEVEDDTSMLDNVSSKVFKVLAADHFVPNRDPDYSSSDSENEDFLPTLGANNFINKQLSQLLSNPSSLQHYQQELLSNALSDLKLAEQIVPNISTSSLESMGKHYELMQQLIGIKEPTLELEKMEKLEEEKEKIEPVLQQLVQTFQENPSFASTIWTMPKAQEQKIDNEENDWLNNLLSNTASMMHEASNDTDMQQFIQNLGTDSHFYNGEQS